MSRYSEYKKAAQKAAKLRPNPLVLSNEARLELNELGVLEISSQSGEVRLSLEGVRQLHKALILWYGDALYIDATNKGDKS